MQQDTLFGEMERPLTQNLYVYCLNNGVNLRDPSGNASLADLRAQYERAQNAGAGASVLAGIQAEIDKIESNSNKPNSGGSGSGNSGSGNNGNNLTPSGGGNSGGNSGGSNYPTGTGNPNTGGNDKHELTEWGKRLYELYKNGQLGLMEREYFQNNILPKINVWPDNGVPVLDGKPRNDYPNYVEGGIHGATDFPAGIGQTFTLLLLVKLLDLLMVILILLIC